ETKRRWRRPPLLLDGWNVRGQGAVAGQVQQRAEGVWSHGAVANARPHCWPREGSQRGVRFLAPGQLLRERDAFLPAHLVRWLQQADHFGPELRESPGRELQLADQCLRGRWTAQGKEVIEPAPREAASFRHLPGDLDRRSVL